MVSGTVSWIAVMPVMVSVPAVSDQVTSPVSDSAPLSPAGPVWMQMAPA